jgi:formylglycine-generating enzyme required for sulfatase activity
MTVARGVLAAALLSLAACSVGPEPQERPPTARVEPARLEPAAGNEPRPAAAHTAQEPLSPEALAHALIAMVDVRAEPPPEASDATGGGLRAGPCAGADVVEIYGAAIVAGRDRDDVYLATADHVAFPCEWTPSRIRVRFHFLPDEEISADAVEVDRDLDLALLRVTETAALRAGLDRLSFELPTEALAGRQVVRVRSAHALRRLDGLRMIGYPENLDWYVNPFGLDLFDSLDQSEGDSTIGFHARFLSTGNSGGGLFTEDWHLVGMVLTERLPFGDALAIDRLVAELPEWPVKLQVPPLPPEPRLVQDCPFCPEMVELPPGSFVMGTPRDRGDPSPNEVPARVVTIDDRLLASRFEITRQQFQAFVDATGYAPAAGCEVWVRNRSSWEREDDKSWRDPGFPLEGAEGSEADRPVVCVDWRDAKAYVAWLSEVTGERYRLLSEAEWEYAARGWSATRFWWGDHAPPNRAVCRQCGSRWDNERPAPAVPGRFPANPFGLFDMTGNVWEWVEDCWHGSYRDAPRDGQPWTTESGGDCSSRMMRGGSLASDLDTLRSANRLKEDPEKRRNDVGFRVARELPAGTVAAR